MIWSWPTDTLKFNFCNNVKKQKKYLKAFTLMQTEHCYPHKMHCEYLAKYFSCPIERSPISTHIVSCSFIVKLIDATCTGHVENSVTNLKKQ
jgi:hypothetical protein